MLIFLFIKLIFVKNFPNLSKINLKVVIDLTSVSNLIQAISLQTRHALLIKLLAKNSC